MCCAECSDMSCSEILPKHLLQILGPSNRHGPYMPQAEAVANERIIFVETAAETSDGDRFLYQGSQSQNYETNLIQSSARRQQITREALSETHLSSLCSMACCCDATPSSLPGNQCPPVDVCLTPHTHISEVAYREHFPRLIRYSPVSAQRRTICSAPALLKL